MANPPSEKTPDNNWMRLALLAAVMIATGVWWWLDPTPGTAPPGKGDAAASASGSANGIAVGPNTAPARQKAASTTTGQATNRAEPVQKPARRDDAGERATQRKPTQDVERRPGSEANKAEDKPVEIERSEAQSPKPTPPPAAPGAQALPASSDRSPPPGSTRAGKVEARVGAGRASNEATSARGPPSEPKDGLKRRIKGVRVLNYGKVHYSGEVDLGPSIARIRRGDRHSHRNDGSVFGNRERRLPIKRRGYYREFVHPTKGIRGPGPQRLVVGKGGEWYYTPDHYKSFIPLGTATWRLPQRRR